jgi:hypothetical protein
MKRLLAAAFVLALAGPALASEEDELTSLSYISYLERYATVQPSTQEESIEAVINMPLVPGDRIDTARQARMEVFLADGNTVWLDEYSTLSLDAVAFSRDTQGDRSVLFLAEGTIMVEISEHRLNPDPIRIDGRSATVYLNATGLYRVLALPSGGLRLEVWEGLAEAATSAGGILVRTETAAEVAGGELTGTEVHLSWGDDFANWVEQRRQVIEGESSQHVDARYDRQAQQLDNYGNWIYLESHNTWAWQPTVSVGWRPYTSGRWYWTPAGWSWLSYEPWGWLPYHYGNWYYSDGYGWAWSWHRWWSPAWVTWGYWGNRLGWCPSGYYWGWYWPRYSHYYGYRPWHHGGGHGGYGGYDQPPRRDAVPRPGSGSATPGGGVRRASVSRPHEITLDLEGRVRVAEMDRRGWNVVSERDFASPHLPRLVETGDVALRDLGDRMGVVSAEPLSTAPPSRVRPSDELQRVFTGVEQRSTRDLTPVLAMDDRLRGEDALRLVSPSTAADVSRRAARNIAPRQPNRAPQPARTGDTASSDRPTLATGSGSPMTTRSATGSTRPTDQRGTVNEPAARSPQRSGSTPRNPYVPRTRPSTGSPSTRPRSWTSPSSPSGPSRREPAQRAPSQGSNPPAVSGRRPSGPVVVPRTSPSRPSRRVAPATPPNRSPSSARRPSSVGRSSPSKPSSPSSKPSGARSRSSSQAKPGRSSPPRSSAPRSAPSSAPRSSGSAKRK